MTAARLRRNHRGEIDSAVLYQAMASAERDERLADGYRRMKSTERGHLYVAKRSLQ